MKPGATGKYPDGKFDRSDEGELNAAMWVDDRGYIRIDFGTPVHWLAMSKKQAYEFARQLMRLAVDRVIDL